MHTYLYLATARVSRRNGSRSLICDICSWLQVTTRLRLTAAMRLSFSLLGAAALWFASGSQALNILMNNDDGFGSANLREVYRLLKHRGHDGLFSNASSCNLCIHADLYVQYGSLRLQPSKVAKADVLNSQQRETSLARHNTILSRLARPL